MLVFAVSSVGDYAHLAEFTRDGGVVRVGEYVHNLEAAGAHEGGAKRDLGANARTRESPTKTILHRSTMSANGTAVVVAGGKDETSCSASAAAGFPAVAPMEGSSVVVVVTFFVRRSLRPFGSDSLG